MTQHSSDSAALSTLASPSHTLTEGAAAPSGLELILALTRNWRLLLGLPMLVGALALAISFAVKPTFTAATVMLPPQQQSSLASSALSSLGALASLAGAGGGGLKSPIDQYVSLLQSVNVADRIIDKFDLSKVYESDLRSRLRTELAANVRIAAGKRDGLITIEVDDHEAVRAADIANAYVDELRRLSSSLAVTEAQQRKVFFEAHLNQAKANLATAQLALQRSGFNRSALKVEPKAAAETFAKLKAEATSAEIRLQSMRSTYAPTAQEVVQQQAILDALNAQLAKVERQSDGGEDADYIGKFREFKYQETLFELFARQYELARVDESREGGLIQVVDKATPPDRKSKPKRLIVTAVAIMAAFVFTAAFILIRHQLGRAGWGVARARQVLRG